MAPARDYFQDLPDALVCRIFTDIGPLHKIAPCRLVCRRWRALFTGVDYLDFECDLLMMTTKKASTRVAMLEAFIGRSIGATTCGVRELHITGPEFGPGAVCIWLRAVNPTVESLTLEEDGEEFVPISTKMLEILRCSLLKELSLSYYEIDRVPADAPPLQRLTSFTLSDATITDRALEEIVGLCPALSCLELSDCSGLSSPYIRHHVLAEIHLSFPHPLTLFTLSTRGENDPKVDTISVKGVSKIAVKAPRLGRLVVKSPCVIGLSRSGTLDRLILQSTDGLIWELSDVMTAISGLARTEVKSVSIPAGLSRIEKVTASKFFGCMTNWAALDIGVDLFKCLRRCVQGELPQLPLKNVTVHVTVLDDKSMEVLKGLVNCCSSLENLSILVKDKNSGWMPAWKFVDGLLKLQRNSKQVEISCSDDAVAKIVQDKEEQDEEEEEDEEDEEEEEDDEEEEEDDDEGDD